MDAISTITIANIENGCKVIDCNAFSYCRSLTSVIIPDSVIYIGIQAFEACDSLEYNEKDGIKYLGNETNPYVVAVGVTSYDITTANIENGCKVIYGAFDTCRSLTSVTIPDSVTSIGYRAFFFSGLTSVTIPDSVTSIGENAFDGCSGLTSATIGNGVISIEKDAFYGCSGLISATIGNGVTSIENGVFRDCTSLTSATIGNGVTSIEEGVFRYCTSLTSVIIPDSVTYIGSHAFV